MKSLFLLHRTRICLYTTTNLISCIIPQTQIECSVTNILKLLITLSQDAQYSHRHDSAGQHLHRKICHQYVINNSIKLVWTSFWTCSSRSRCYHILGFFYQIGSNNTSRLTDIIVKDRKEESFHTDWHEVTKIFLRMFLKKLSKYKDQEREIEKMCHLKTKAVPVVVGVFGLIKNGIQE